MLLLLGLAPCAAAGAGAAGAAAGPAVVVVAAVEAAKKAKETAQATYDTAAGALDETSGGGAEPGWTRTANEPPPRDPTEPMPREEW